MLCLTPRSPLEEVEISANVHGQLYLTITFSDGTEIT